MCSWHPSPQSWLCCKSVPEDPACTQVAANPEKNTATLAVATLQNLAAESSANREAIREAGGIPILVSLIKAGPDSPVSLSHPQTTQLQQAHLSQPRAGRMLEPPFIATLNDRAD